MKLFEPMSSKMYKLAFATTEDSDQPARTHSLTRGFNGILWATPTVNVQLFFSQKTKIQSFLRLVSDLNLRCTHMPI